MKLLEIYKQILSEISSPIVYHKTHIGNLLSMLEDNEFKFTLSVGGTGADDKFNKRKGKYYYFSTARSRASAYFRIGDYSVLLTIDGDKLSNVVHAKPVDYWGREFRQVKDNPSNEMEDRFFHDKQYVKNAVKYIKQVDILLPKKYEKKLKYMDVALLRGQGKSEDEIDAMRGKVSVDYEKMEDNYKRIIRKVIYLCKKHNIPIYFYTNEKAMKYGWTNRAVEVDIGRINTKPKEKEKTWANDYSYNRERIPNILTKYVVEFYYDQNPSVKSFDRLSDYYKKPFEDFLIRGDFGFMLRQWGNEIHNLKSRKSNKYTRQLVKILKRHNIKTIKELLEIVHEKFVGKFVENVVKDYSKIGFKHVKNISNNEMIFDIPVNKIDFDDSQKEWMKLRNLRMTLSLPSMFMGKDGDFISNSDWDVWRDVSKKIKNYIKSKGVKVNP